jgi:hypothetical protein
MRKIFLFSLVVLFCSFSTSAFSADVAICGASSGYTYFANRGLVDAKDVGWQKDGMSSGQFTLTIDGQGKFDILASGPLGVASYLKGGAKIIPTEISDTAVAIVAIYPFEVEAAGVVDTYVFQKLKNGKLQAMYTQARPGELLPKISALIADCSYLNLSLLKK